MSNTISAEPMQGKQADHQAVLDAQAAIDQLRTVKGIAVPTSGPKHQTEHAKHRTDDESARNTEVQETQLKRAEAQRCSKPLTENDSAARAIDPRLKLIASSTPERAIGLATQYATEETSRQLTNGAECADDNAGGYGPEGFYVPDRYDRFTLNFVRAVLLHPTFKVYLGNGAELMLKLASFPSGRSFIQDVRADRVIFAGDNVQRLAGEDTVEQARTIMPTVRLPLIPVFQLPGTSRMQAVYRMFVAMTMVTGNDEIFISHRQLALATGLGHNAAGQVSRIVQSLEKLKLIKRTAKGDRQRKGERGTASTYRVMV